MILDRAKAWAALVGAIITALIASGVVPTGGWYDYLTIASVIATAVATYSVKNVEKTDGAASKD